jgi:phosphomannomutase
MTDKYNFHPSILRAYDIRGIIGQTLSTADAYQLGRSYATFAQKNGLHGAVAIGRDGRLSSPELSNALIKGLLESGYDVIDIGLVPTPALYYASYTQNVIGGIMVTGSHNPPNHNGFKMVMNKASVYGDDINTLGKIASSGEFITGKASLVNKDLKNDYVTSLIKNAYKPAGKKLKIAWDPGNGATGEIVEMLAKMIDAEHVLLNTKIDGTFPAHHPDPTLHENMEQLIDAVIKEKCDIGIAFDGDGDRIGAIDNLGRMIYGDQLLLIFSKDLLARRPGEKIIADVKTSNSVFERIRAFGGDAIMWKTGHSLVKAKMKESHSMLAGEMSGHIFFGENYYGFDDALFGACKLIGIMAHQKASLAETIDTFPISITTPELRIDVDEESKFQIVEDVKKELTANNKKFLDLDGIRVNEQRGWWLLRASNTQSCLIMRIEGTNLEDLYSLAAEVKGYFKTLNLSCAEIEAAVAQVKQ